MRVQVDERRENPWRRRKMGMFCLKTGGAQNGPSVGSLVHMVSRYSV